MLLLDEPLGALDYQLRKTLQIELKDLQEELGLTFVFVTHDQEEALTMSDRIVIMDKGEIQQDDDPNTIYHYPKTKFVAEFIGESNFFDNGKEILVLRPEKLNLCGGKDGDDSHPAPRFFGTVDDVIFTAPSIKYSSVLTARARKSSPTSTLMTSTVGRSTTM